MSGKHLKMALAVFEYQGQRIGEGPTGEAFLTSAQESACLVEACANAGVDKIILYPENLPSKFFDLSSREAGEVLGKLRNYFIRLAVIQTPALILSRRFVEILGEERRSGFFGLFTSRNEALDWLTKF
jgi:hypothetical protein